MQKVIDTLRKLERGIEGVRLEMTTRGSYPGGLEFRTSGTLRVLAATHFHIQVESLFSGAGKQLRSEVEKVITPEGVRTRQHGPIESVYTKMSPTLMRRLELAQKDLAAADKAKSSNGVAVPGLLSEGGRAPLGSAMLVALAQQFVLSPQPATRQLDGLSCRVFSGPWRAAKEPKDAKDAKDTKDTKDTKDARDTKDTRDAKDTKDTKTGESAVVAPAAEGVGPVAAEVVLRPDGVPIAMRHFGADKKVLLELRVRKLQLNPGFTADSFVLLAPEGTVFQDVMDHRPSRAQIERLLDEHAALSSEPDKQKAPR